jgi:transcriptional regulator of acetoin/glycerol metabolism
MFELINFIEYAFVVCPDHVIRLSDLPRLTPCLNGLAKLRPQVCVEENQKEKLIEALIMAKGKKAAAARMLGVSRQTVWSWIRKYSINRDLLTSRVRE